MRSPSSFEKIFLCRRFVDMRKAINGLSVIVQSEMKLDVFSEYIFVFCNEKRDILKILYWDRSGFALLAKEAGEGAVSLAD